jgi:ribosomal protein S18 acetylase RimI-like enzyme
MGDAAAGATLTRRPSAPSDTPFLEGLYASTRTGELAVLPWSEEQKSAFIRSQFNAQSAQYTASYPDASFEVVMIDGTPAGRLYVDRRGDQISIIDIALLPQFRGTGWGSALIGEILAEASLRAATVGLFVEHRNRAQRLYRRLGFTVIADTGVYLQMRWSSPETQSPQAKTAS